MKPEERARDLFRREYGAEPAAVASAPGRVNLIGEHVDYHGGHVLPVATDMRTAVAVGPDPGRMRGVSEHAVPAVREWPPVSIHTWSDYCAGVATLYDRASGPWAAGLAVAVASDVPKGAGLSSSAALEVATACALGRWAERPLSAAAIADLAWRAETEFVGVPCGRMDQMASAMAPPGAALLIDCATLETQPVPVGLDIVVADSGEEHRLAESSYVARRREGAEAIGILRQSVPVLDSLVDIPPARLPALTKLLPAPLDRRVRHVVNENQRAVLGAKALERGDFAGFGALVSASHASLRELYECSTERLDAIVAAAARLDGVLGARLVGAGWGGSVLIVVEPEKGESVAEILGSDKKLAMPAVRLIRPGAGALS
jgi:galactokinase